MPLAIQEFMNMNSTLPITMNELTEKSYKCLDLWL